MDRRLLGVTVLILVVLVAMAAPRWGGRPVAGSAHAESVQPAPAVGDCVAGVVGSIPEVYDEADATSVVQAPSAVYTRCRGTVLGEVMAVSAADTTPSGIGAGPYSRAEADCRLTQVTYIGTIGPFDPTRLDRPTIGWQAAVTIDTAVFGPTRRQREAGQRWLACAAVEGSGSRYQGRLKQALTVGALPGDFATCWRTLQTSTDQRTGDELVSCDQGHQVEVLGTTQVINPATTAAEIDQSCRSFAARALRTTALTRDPRLTIRAYALDGSSVLPLTSVQLTAGFLGCAATVDGRSEIRGTLIGIGERPIPITG